MLQPEDSEEDNDLGWDSGFRDIGGSKNGKNGQPTPSIQKNTYNRAPLHGPPTQVITGSQAATSSGSYVNTAHSGNSAAPAKGWMGSAVGNFINSVGRKTLEAAPQVQQSINRLGSQALVTAKSLANTDSTGTNLYLLEIGQLMRYLAFDLVIRIGQKEVTDNLDHGDLITRVVTGTSLRQIANAILEIWLNTKPEAFGGGASWSSIAQSDWLAKMYRVSLGPKETPSTFSLALALDNFCAALGELALALKGDNIKWKYEERAIWELRLNEVRRLIQDISYDIRNTPSKLSLPAMKIVKLGGGLSSQFGLTSTSVYHKMGGDVGIPVSDVLLEMSYSEVGILSPPSVQAPRPVLSSGTGETVPNPEAQAAFEDQVKWSVKSLLEKKLYPVMICNRSNAQLRVCLYASTDKILALPVGGIGGVGTITLDPNKRAFMRLDGTEFWVKTFRPGLIDRPLYTSLTTVKRGQTLNLRSHDCQIEH